MKMGFEYAPCKIYKLSAKPCHYKYSFFACNLKYAITSYNGLSVQTFIALEGKSFLRFWSSQMSLHIVKCNKGWFNGENKQLLFHQSTELHFLQAPQTCSLQAVTWASFVVSFLPREVQIFWRSWEYAFLSTVIGKAYRTVMRSQHLAILVFWCMEASRFGQWNQICILNFFHTIGKMGIFLAGFFFCEKYGVSIFMQYKKGWINAF